MSGQPVPNAALANPSPDYLRRLIEAAKVSQAEVARAIGVDARTFRRYVLGESRVPYAVQFAVECFARSVRFEQPPVKHLDTDLLEAALAKRQRALGKMPPTSRARDRMTARIALIERELRARRA
jgi:transcriptional regulator with XRE-family HTH domain